MQKLLFLCCWLCVCQGRLILPFVNEQNHLLQNERNARADAFIRTLFPSQLHGLAVVVVNKKKILFQQNYGDAKANQQKIDQNTIFQIGSVSKTFVTLGLALLVEEGKVSWTGKVVDYLPWLQFSQQYVTENMKLGDLLSMTSGFGEGQGELLEACGASYSSKETVKKLKYLKPNNGLREKYDYANINFEIAGLIIEEITKLPWYEFLRQRIWQPLGMSDTYGSYTEVPKNKKGYITNGYFTCGKMEVVVSASNSSLGLSPTVDYDAAGSVVSTTSDMSKFMRMILNDGRHENTTLFKNPEKSILEMAKSHASVPETFVKLISGISNYNPVGDPVAAGYGYDIISRLYLNKPYFDKSGDTFAHSTRTGFLPNDGLAALVFSNDRTCNPSLTYFPSAIRTYLLGLYSGVPDNVLTQRYKKNLEHKQDLSSMSAIVPPLEKESDHSLENYTGSFHHKFYGTVTIQLNNNTLSWTYGVSRGHLMSVGGNTFRSIFPSAFDKALLCTISFPKATFRFRNMSVYSIFLEGVGEFMRSS